MLLLPIFFFLTVAGYGQTEEVFDYGNIQNNTYTNSYFKLKINIPPAWSINSIKLTDTSYSNARKDSLVKAKNVSYAALLMMSKYKMGSVFDFNPHIEIVGERVSYMPEVITGEDFLKKMRDVYIKTYPQYVVDENIYKEKINGNTFYKFNIVMNNSKVIKNTIYSIVKKGFCLSIHTTYNSAADEEELSNILKTLYISN